MLSCCLRFSPRGNRGGRRIWSPWWHHWRYLSCLTRIIRVRWRSRVSVSGLEKNIKNSWKWIIILDFFLLESFESIFNCNWFPASNLVVISWKYLRRIFYEIFYKFTLQISIFCFHVKIVINSHYRFSDFKLLYHTFLDFFPFRNFSLYFWTKLEITGFLE